MLKTRSFAKDKRPVHGLKRLKVSKRAVLSIELHDKGSFSRLSLLDWGKTVKIWARNSNSNEILRYQFVSPDHKNPPLTKTTR